MHFFFFWWSSFLLREIPWSAICPFYKDTAGTVGTFQLFSVPYIMNSLNSVSQDQWSNFFSVLLHYRASVFHLSNFAFPSFSSSLPYFSRFLPTNDQILVLLVVSFVVLRITCICLEVSLFNKVKCVRTVQENPTNHRCVFSCILYWVFLETSIHFSGMVNDSALDAQSLTLESTWWSHVKSSEINQKSFGFFTGIQKWVLKM